MLFFKKKLFLCLFSLTNTKAWRMLTNTLQCASGTCLCHPNLRPWVQLLRRSSILMFLCLSSDDKYSNSDGKSNNKKRRLQTSPDSLRFTSYMFSFFKGTVVKACQDKEARKPPPFPTLMCVVLPRGVRRTSNSSLPQLSAEGLAGGRWSGRGPATCGGPWLGESGRGSTAHSQSRHLLGHLRTKRKGEAKM